MQIHVHLKIIIIEMSKPQKYANKIRMVLVPGVNVGPIIKQTTCI